MQCKRGFLFDARLWFEKGGIYTALHGDGLVVRDGQTIINGGLFDGYNEKTESGTGSSYALKILGGTLDVYNGSFGTGDSVAPNTAITTAGRYANCLLIVGQSAARTAVGNIHRGRFVTTGNAALFVFDFADLHLGKLASDNTSVVVTANGAAITMEALFTSANPLSVTIYHGTYTRVATSSNSWGGTLYIDNAKAALTIRGGDFYVTNNAVIKFVKRSNPSMTPVHIYGGEFHITKNNYGKIAGLQGDGDNSSNDRALNTGASLPYTNSDFNEAYVILGDSASDSSYRCTASTTGGITTYTFGLI